MADVFLSFSDEDTNTAERVARVLEASGYEVWFDAHLSGGDSFAQMIEQQLNLAKAVVVLWSENSRRSKWVFSEALFARDQEKLVQASIDASLPPLFFREFNSADLNKWDGRIDHPSIREIVAGVEKLAGRKVSQEPADVRQWSIVQTSNTAEDFDDFARLFPKSKFAREARRRSAALSKAGRQASARLEPDSRARTDVEADAEAKPPLRKVFLSYRRDDSQAVARLLFERLTAKLGPDAVFFDVDGIPVGEEFDVYMFRQLVECSTFVAIVGLNWAGRKEDGSYRIQEPLDFVRREVELAFDTKLRMIPVLVGKAEMPLPSQLPSSLEKFPRIQGARLDLGRDYETHIDKLLVAITRDIIQPQWQIGARH